MNNSQTTSENHRLDVPLGALSQIAWQKMRIPTLAPRRSDCLDFHDCSVWSIKAALVEAFLLGRGDIQPTLEEDEALLQSDLRGLRVWDRW